MASTPGGRSQVGHEPYGSPRDPDTPSHRHEDHGTGPPTPRDTAWTPPRAESSTLCRASYLPDSQQTRLQLTPIAGINRPVTTAINVNLDGQPHIHDMRNSMVKQYVPQAFGSDGPGSNLGSEAVVRRRLRRSSQRLLGLPAVCDRDSFAEQ
jgi:hypothetical protein